MTCSAPTREFNSQPAERISNVTPFLIVAISAMAWPAGYGLGVLLRPEVTR